jgi:hypothetical protein
MTDPEITTTSKSIDPRISVQTSGDLPTLAADYVKCVTHTKAQSCTLQFFRIHVTPKVTTKGIEAEDVAHKLFLEVKLPAGAVFALAIYLSDLFKKLREGKDKNVTFFYGPVSIKEEVGERQE